MSAITNSFVSVSQAQNGRIARDEGHDQTDGLNVAPSGGQTEGLYLAFVNLKDIADGRGDDYLRNHCMDNCRDPEPERRNIGTYNCRDTYPDLKRLDKPDKPDKPEKPKRP